LCILWLSAIVNKYASTNASVRKYASSGCFRLSFCECQVNFAAMKLLLLLLRSVEFADDVALLLSVAGLDMGPHLTPEFEIGGTDSAALRTSWTCLWLCGSCVTGCTIRSI